VCSSDLVRVAALDVGAIEVAVCGVDRALFTVLRALDDTAVDPHPRPERGIEARDAAGRGQESRVGVLGAEAGFDRRAALRHLEQIDRFLSERRPPEDVIAEEEAAENES
jgi:hypothetical protein